LYSAIASVWRFNCRKRWRIVLRKSEAGIEATAFCAALLLFGIARLGINAAEICDGDGIVGFELQRTLIIFDGLLGVSLRGEA